MNLFKHTEGSKIFFEDFGMPFASTPVSAETLAKYRGKLPDRLLEYWQEFGFCGFKDGIFWLTNPEDYEDILAEWLPEDELEKQSHYVIARSGFGDLFVWNSELGNDYKIIGLWGWISKRDPDFSDWIRDGRDGEVIDGFFGFQVYKELDTQDNDGNPLFQRCVELWGPLAENEMFTFAPYPFISDSKTLDAIRKADLFINFDIVRQMKEPEILTTRDLLRKGWGI